MKNDHKALIADFLLKHKCYSIKFFHPSGNSKVARNIWPDQFKGGILNTKPFNTSDPSLSWHLIEGLLASVLGQEDYRALHQTERGIKKDKFQCRPGLAQFTKKEVRKKRIKLWIEPGDLIVSNRANVFRLLHIESQQLSDVQKNFLAELVNRESSRMIQVPEYFDGQNWKKL